MEIIIINILKFLENNIVSVIAILGTVILCIIFCIISNKKIAKRGLATFLAIIISIGLITGIIYLGSVQNDGNFNKFRITGNNNPTLAFKKYIDAFAENDINTLIENTAFIDKNGNNVDYKESYPYYISFYFSEFDPTSDFDPNRVIEISEQIEKNNATLYVKYKIGVGITSNKTFFMKKIK